jgi:hypothetical protein
MRLFEPTFCGVGLARLGETVAFANGTLMKVL